MSSQQNASGSHSLNGRWIRGQINYYGNRTGTGGVSLIGIETEEVLAVILRARLASMTCQYIQSRQSHVALYITFLCTFLHSANARPELSMSWQRLSGARCYVPFAAHTMAAGKRCI